MSAQERPPKVPLTSSAQSPIPTWLPPGLRPRFPALMAHALHLLTSSDACPLQHGVIYLLELVILLHVHYNRVYVQLTLLNAASNLQSFAGKHSPHPGRGINTDSKARAITLWPTFLETIPPLWAVLVKRLLW